jgi:MerR family transcriptional regulator/heat shock protein HspR
MARKIDPKKPLFTIGAVAEVLGIAPRMLRFYEERGLIAPSRTDGNRRLYSLDDMDELAYIQFLTTVRKVNIAGVLEIQTILAKLDPATREQFMKEVELEIERLPGDKKKAFSGTEETVANDIIRDADKLFVVEE